MKKFYDREQEMNQLRDMQQQAFNDYSRFVVLTGRRRVGKTSLVYRLMEETKEQAPGLYFFVGRKTEATLVRTFCEEARMKLGEYVPEGIATFRSLMQLLLEIGKRRKFTLFVDEFQDSSPIQVKIFDREKLFKYLRPGSRCSDSRSLDHLPKIFILDKLSCIFHGKNDGTRSISLWR